MSFVTKVSRGSSPSTQRRRNRSTLHTSLQRAIALMIMLVQMIPVPFIDSSRHLAAHPTAALLLLGVLELDFLASHKDTFSLLALFGKSKRQ